MPWKEMVLAGANAGLGLISGKRARKHQAKLQKELNEQAAQLNYQYGEQSAENAYQRQMALYNRTYQDNSPANRVQQLEDAGLSVGLMYGGAGGTGGMGQASTAPQGTGAQGLQAGQAAQAATELDAIRTITELGLQKKTTNANVKVAENQADKLKAETENIKEQTETETGKRDIMIETMRQQGLQTWIDNEERNWHYRDPEIHGSKEVVNPTLSGEMQFYTESTMSQQIAADIAKAYGEAANSNAMAELNTQKKLGYWQELLNATTHADADKVKAAATKLAAEWSTGVYTNWKTWADIGTDVVNTLGNIIKAAKPAGKGITINK